MNFIFVSPQFPRVYWNFCDRLKKKGVNVLGIGDTPYDQLAHEVRESLTEYYFVPSLADYDQMLRAVAFFTFKYGRIDWLESYLSARQGGLLISTHDRYFFLLWKNALAVFGQSDPAQQREC